MQIIAARKNYLLIFYKINTLVSFGCFKFAKNLIRVEVLAVKIIEEYPLLELRICFFNKSKFWTFRSRP